MKSILKPSIWIVCWLACASCEKTGLCTDEKLSLTRSDLTATPALQTNGYYYGAPITETGPGGRTYQKVLVLYQNGVLLSAGAAELPKLNEYVRSIERSTRTPGGNVPGRKSSWGICTLDGRSIQLNYWIDGHCGRSTVLATGDVLNDTTFQITQLEKHYPDSRGVQTEAVEQRFSFRRFAPKPDSTNRFIP
ncbi:hypothetical protein F0P96_04755 [Hymenobacter busanensis]|uniref:Uncharacterized protein n=1 Tax=Hymenobacter busanensis TaxID=2607656 RepID=A0A7L5A2K3_9BACT|nr:hypothetical protein [Hymenobacter busanensis]KAA9338162.1 hypothetical protein F0P96_04755 [Hymenobacter busanensis]QHJ09413.1 hypothetical protein GUY19_19855 [Hymenobacter busanensis]